MNKGSLKFASYLFIAVLLTLGLTVSLQSLLAAWTAPTAGPPADNVNPPIFNEHSTPATNALINKPLSVGGNLTMGGNIVMDGNWLSGDGGNEGVYVDDLGNVGIGTPAPQTKLHVSGGNITLDHNNGINLWDGTNAMTVITGYGSYNWGHNLQIGPGAELIVGSGESGNSLRNNEWATGGTETLFIASDQDIQFWTALQDPALTDRVMTITNTGNVGIGITGPGAKLDVVGTIQSKSTAGILKLAETDDLNVWWVVADGNTFSVRKNNTAPYPFKIQSDLDVEFMGGNVGIGTTNPGEKLEVNGNVKATAFLYSSDRSLKKDIQKIDNALLKIRQLEGVSFKWKENSQPSLGLIAQDLEEVFPELVSTNENTGLKSVQYGNLIAPLIEAIKEQQKQIEELRQEIKELNAN